MACVISFTIPMHLPASQTLGKVTPLFSPRYKLPRNSNQEICLLPDTNDAYDGRLLVVLISFHMFILWFVLYCAVGLIPLPLVFLSPYKSNPVIWSSVIVSFSVCTAISPTTKGNITRGGKSRAFNRVLSLCFLQRRILFLNWAAPGAVRWRKALALFCNLYGLDEFDNLKSYRCE